MAAFLLESVGGESMTMGSPTSPKPGVNAQFLPGFLMGDLPAPIAPQPRPSLSFMESRSPLLGGGSPPQPVVPSHKEKSGAPPVGSIYDDILLPGLNTTPLSSRRLTNFNAEMPSSPSTPYAYSRAFSPSTTMQSRKALSPAQLDPFHTQGDALTSNDHLDDTWVTVYGFPQASSSYILLQFAQYGNIIKHVMSNAGNWMHLQYQSKLQARKALSKDGKIFGDCIMIGVKPCIDKSLMESTEKAPVSSVYSCVTPRVKSISSPRSGMRPLAAAYRASTSPYKVFMNRQTPKKDNTLVSKALEYLFGW
ncbi:nucleoporin NUP35-like isoform X1 [Ranitomeya variabilis]|uniref:nucleoporin NUP35-like isoform X1 n=2 Tax=Ranitomeya variabilis TaxID=490064 RepID=UPI004057012C